MNYENDNQNSKMNFTKSQKAVIIGLLSVIILLLTILIISPNFKDENSRTIMIYIVGSNLETDSKIVSADLKAINPKKIDLKSTNVLLYTGGTEKWHNFISSDDNGIYILKSTGFEKLESQEQLNLGDPSTLTQFLKYGYENYKSDKYDLILYNHGGAIDGAIYDDLSGDNLSLKDMEEALKNSPFNSKNKIETVLFRTCLNGTIELANTFKDYANYLIGSEEISYGSTFTNVLGFLNNIEKKDSGLEYGKKFIEIYEDQMEIIDRYNSMTRTYSVIDLSKIDKLNKELDKYISSIDLPKNYSEISKLRANLYQYGMEATTYDMIDLYEFIIQIEKYATQSNKKLLNALEEAIVYNSTNETSSHGLSIYFPYAGTKGSKNKYLAVYEELNYSEEYKNFIKTFNNIQKSPSGFKFDLSSNKSELNDNNNEISIQLTKEQIDNYAYATFSIFKKEEEHPNYYKPLFNTNRVTLENDGKLKVNFANQLLQINNEGKYEYIMTFVRDDGRRIGTASLYNTNLDFTSDGYRASADIYIGENNKGQPIVSTAKLISNNERIDGVLLNLKDYTLLSVFQPTYKILNDKGNVLSTEEWESAPVIYGYEEYLDKIEFKYASLDKGDNYYALFIITDIYGNATMSKLIKVGE